MAHEMSQLIPLEKEKKKLNVIYMIYTKQILLVRLFL